ncbi:hypothetical protein ASE06_15830 [Sphingopyxis sp. Root214]|uniref:cupin domain-containing protein n=1 Tax=unclassified Sphingopyxis TaxID=2614943 RepID=UPI0006F2E22B|nr:MULTISPECIES: cupin domain-containing protein [unclassified Sphingopyxis]KQZ73804.1 hypothetical protein ASD73_13485 [Sphingopyxis sp. Root154]KRC07945.1 hypothetical protein ASE06_15830 [Sphingopyxis sp. Root214]
MTHENVDVPTAAATVPEALLMKAMGGLIKFRQMRPNFFIGSDNPEFHGPTYKYCDGGDPSIAVSRHPAVQSEEVRMITGVCQPGQGAPLHNHTGEELMFAASGSWVVYFDAEEKNKVFLEPWDALVLPGGVPRGWRNVGDTLGCFLNISAVTDKMSLVRAG